MATRSLVNQACRLGKRCLIHFRFLFRIMVDNIFPNSSEAIIPMTPSFDAIAPLYSNAPVTPERKRCLDASPWLISSSQSSIFPVLKPPLPRSIQDDKPMRRKHNTLIQFPTRASRFRMPRPQPAFIRIFPRVPETYYSSVFSSPLLSSRRNAGRTGAKLTSRQIPPLPPQIRLPKPILQQPPTLTRLAMALIIEFVQPLLIHAHP